MQLQDVLATIQSMADAVKASDLISAETKNDSEIEATQFTSELRRSKPNLNRLKESFEWFKRLDGAAQLGLHLFQLSNKLTDLFPGFLG